MPCQCRGIAGSINAEADWLLLVWMTMIFKWVIYQPIILLFATSLHLRAANKVARQMAVRSGSENRRSTISRRVAANNPHPQRGGGAEMVDLAEKGNAMVSNPMNTSRNKTRSVENPLRSTRATSQLIVARSRKSSSFFAGESGDYGGSSRISSTGSAGDSAAVDAVVNRMRGNFSSARFGSISSERSRFSSARFGSISSERSISDNWATHTDDDSGNNYFECRKSGRVVWTLPEGGDDEIGEAKGGEGVKGAGGADVGGLALEESPSAYMAVEAAGGGAAGQWVEHYDDANECPYWHNEASGESRYEDPYRAAAEDGASGGGGGGGGSGAGAGADDFKIAEEVDVALDGGGAWTEHYDDENACPYWHNEATGVSVHAD